VSIADLFPPEDRGKFHGILGALYAVAIAVGPIMGVFVAEWLSWNWTFLLIARAGAPVLALTVRSFPRPHSLPGQREMDYPDMVVLALAVGEVVLSLSSAGVLDTWDAPLSIGPLVFGLAAAEIFVVIESRSRSPIMPLGIYRHRAVSVAVIVTLVTAVSLHGFVPFLPLYFLAVLGMSATRAGTLLIPMLLGIALGAILAGQLLSRTVGHYRTQTLVSAGLMAAGMYLFSTLDGGGGFAGGGPILFSQTYLVITAIAFRRRGGHALCGGPERSPVTVRDALPEGLLDSVQEDARALVDPAVAQALKETVVETGSGDVPLADSLLDSLNLALTGALSDVFTVLWVAAALSIPVALFLRVRHDTDHRSKREGSR